jgi:hypothetical protein
MLIGGRVAIPLRRDISAATLTAKTRMYESPV